MIINLHILPLTFSLNFVHFVIYWLLYCVTFITEFKKKDWASVNDIEKGKIKVQNYFWEILSKLLINRRENEKVSDRDTERLNQNWMFSYKTS